VIWQVDESGLEDEGRSTLLVDIGIAERRRECEIERVTSVLMVRKLKRRYEAHLDFEELLESVINEETSITDAQRHAYKYVVGREFWRRQRKKQLQTSKGRNT